MTHVVYVKSRWGLAPLSEPCDAEFRYILANLPRAIATEDVELVTVGEFLHCLRILGRTTSPTQQALVQQGRALLARHSEFWASRASLYKMFHTAWCIAVGLT